MLKDWKPGDRVRFIYDPVEHPRNKIYTIEGPIPGEVVPQPAESFVPIKGVYYHADELMRENDDPPQITAEIATVEIDPTKMITCGRVGKEVRIFFNDGNAAMQFFHDLGATHGWTPADGYGCLADYGLVSKWPSKGDFTKR